MIIETGKTNTVRAKEVTPGGVVSWDGDYWLRGDAVDEYGDPLFIRLNDGEVVYPDEDKIVTPFYNAKVIV